MRFKSLSSVSIFKEESICRKTEESFSLCLRLAFTPYTFSRFYTSICCSSPLFNLPLQSELGAAGVTHTRRKCVCVFVGLWGPDELIRPSQDQYINNSKLSTSILRE